MTTLIDASSEGFSAAKDFAPTLDDPFGRRIEYLRVSLTDRCDLRCSYCMPVRMKFVPKKEILSIEELIRIIDGFVRQGIRIVRLTGGEPLVRRGIDLLLDHLGEKVRNGDLKELTLTTNGVALPQNVDRLVAGGVKRINVSLDTLNPKTFEKLTRRPVLDRVLNGIDAAQMAGIQVKLNTVALKNANLDEIPSIIQWAHERHMDISLIEIMPMGDIDEDRREQFAPLSDVKADLEMRWSLVEDAYRTGGPSRYFRVEETGGRIGFITPLSNNFCDSCNRVRITCTGKLYQCLGRSNHFDFRSLIRAGATDSDLDNAIRQAITVKPWGHDFASAASQNTSAVQRQMSVTGG
ncbi:MAG: GTP 3',8-cyclase MoaA [Parvularculaceae bacterium]